MLVKAHKLIGRNICNGKAEREKTCGLVDTTRKTVDMVCLVQMLGQQSLLNNRADVHAKDKSGLVPLHCTMPVHMVHMK